MTFDEWYATRLPQGFKSYPTYEDCWQAAQKDAAMRCAEIWHNTQTPDFLSALSREFGLDHHD